MRRAVMTLAACLAASACGGGGRALELAGPAPADALSCALGTAVTAGYEPREGGVSDGYIVLTRNRATTAGEAGKEAAARVLSMGMLGGGKHIDYDALRVVGAGGRLNILAWSIDSGNDQRDPTEEGKADAQKVLETCGAR